MSLQKGLNRIVKGVTSSPQKKNLIKTRIEELINNIKKTWYKKLHQKLVDI